MVCRRAWRPALTHGQHAARGCRPAAETRAPPGRLARRAGLLSAPNSNTTRAADASSDAAATARPRALDVPRLAAMPRAISVRDRPSGACCALSTACPARRRPRRHARSAANEAAAATAAFCMLAAWLRDAGARAWPRRAALPKLDGRSDCFIKTAIDAQSWLQEVFLSWIPFTSSSPLPLFASSRALRWVSRLSLEDFNSAAPSFYPVLFRRPLHVPTPAGQA